MWWREWSEEERICWPRFPAIKSCRQGSPRDRLWDAEICVQLFHSESLRGHGTSVYGRGKKTGLGGGTCEAVTAKASPTPAGRSGAWMGFQSCSPLEASDVTPCSPKICRWPQGFSPRGCVTLAVVALSGWRQLLGRNTAEHQQPATPRQPEDGRPRSGREGVVGSSPQQSLHIDTQTNSSGHLP